MPKIKNIVRLKNFYVSCERIVDKRNLKKALNHGLVLEKNHKVIKFNQKPWLKLYTNMNAELTKKKTRFWKIFLQNNK